MKTLVLSFTLTLLFYNAYSCTCTYAGNFSKVAKNADFVALVKIIDHEDYFSLVPEADTTKRPMSVRVEIIKKYRGSEDRQELKIFGDNGYLCRESILHLKEGRYYVVAVHKSQNKIWEYGIIETDNDYHISSCGEYLLSYNPINKTVIGSRRKRLISMKKLEQILKR